MGLPGMWIPQRGERMKNGNDLISQQAATEMKLIDGGKLIADLRRYGHETISIDGLEGLIATQPEITDGQAIEHLQESGWMQNHDKQMYEMGLREQLADDSDSYDALLSSAQPERLTDDDFETIRIHLNAFKEKLCNQHRWKEAEKYQRIIDRFMAFASAQPERMRGKWIDKGWNGDWQYQTDGRGRSWHEWQCSGCNHITKGAKWNFCPQCGADMRGKQDERHDL